jgi:hypothetical protein
MNKLAAALVLCASLAWSGSALAQDSWTDEPAETGGADEPAPTDNPPPSTRTSSGFPAAPPPPPPTDARPRRVHASRSRFRGGVSGLLGSYWLDGRGSGAIGVMGRLGAQVTDVFGVYATPTVLTMPGYGDRGLTRASLGVVFDATIDHRFYIGGGPEIFGTFRSGGLGPVVEDQRLFALRMRTGLAFGSVRPGRRHAFTLGFDGSLDFYDGTLGVAPALSLGYDAF